MEAVLKATTDFEKWFSAIPPLGFEDLYDLYRSVADGVSHGWYKVTRKGNILFVIHGDMRLVIASDAAKMALLNTLLDMRGEETDLDMDGWYHFRRETMKG
jgi:hypothetical protein